MAILEVCVDNLQSVEATIEGGGTRIELCSSLLDGGLTPSVGLLQLVKSKHPSLTVFVMIRPRGGDFCYSQEEIDIMKMDIQVLKKAGADGFVFGCLTIQADVDLEANKVLLDQASPLPCTFHRAFDMSRDATTSLQSILALGFLRILTSGHAKSALEGIDEITRLVELADGRIIIIPGCGINCGNVGAIMLKTKATEYHSSCSVVHQSPMQHRNTSISMGKQTDCSEYCWKVTSKHIVQRMMQTVANLNQ